MEKNERKSSGRRVKQKSKKYHSNKRRWHGKTKTKEEEDMSFEEVVGEADFSIELVEEEVENVETIREAVPESASTSKVIDIEPDIPLGREPVTSGFMLVDMEILGSVINCLACPECFGSSSPQLHDINEKKKGLARLLEIRCTS